MTIPTTGADVNDAVESVANEAFAQWRHELHAGGDLAALMILDNPTSGDIAKAGLRFGAAAMLKRLADLGLIDRHIVNQLTGTRHDETTLNPPQL